MIDEPIIIDVGEMKEVKDDFSGDEDATRMVSVFIPECCREGWESCPHVVNRPKRRAKRNIGL